MSTSIRQTARDTNRQSTIRYTLLGYVGDGGISPIPPNALVDDNGVPILDQDGNYILTGP